MKLHLLIFIAFIPLGPHFAQAETKWQYSEFNFLNTNSGLRANEPTAIAISRKKFIPLLAKNSATHRVWGVDQVYIGSNKNERVFIKYNTQVKGRAPVGTWAKLGKGHVLHLKQKNKMLTAYYAQGLNQKELNLLKIKFQTKNRTAYIPNTWFINCAYAETTRHDGTGFDSFMNEPPQIDNGNFLNRSGNVVRCVGAEALDVSMERAQHLWESATWENVRNTAGTVWNAVPTSQQVAQRAASAGRWTWDRVSDPVDTWNRVTNSYDQTREVLASIYAQVSESLAGFSDLPPEVQDEIVCHIAAQVAAEGVLGVAIGVTGAGATVAVARLLNRVRTITGSLAAKMPRIRLVVERPPAERRQATREILGEAQNAGPKGSPAGARLAVVESDDRPRIVVAEILGDDDGNPYVPMLRRQDRGSIPRVTAASGPINWAEGSVVIERARQSLTSQDPETVRTAIGELRHFRLNLGSTNGLPPGSYNEQLMGVVDDLVKFAQSSRGSPALRREAVEAALQYSRVNSGDYRLGYLGRRAPESFQQLYYNPSLPNDVRRLVHAEMSHAYQSNRFGEFPAFIPSEIMTQQRDSTGWIPGPRW